MDQTGDTTPPQPLLVLGDTDAAVCADGFCAVPAPEQAAAKAEAADAD
jgi:hypothetical protein